jgi:Family of unknown function (DUF6328)
VDITLPVALDPHGVPSARENWRIAELVLRDVEFVGIETFVIMQQVPRQSAIFVADAEEAAKRHHCIRYLSTHFIDHDALDRAEFFSIAAAHRSAFNLVACDQVSGLPSLDFGPNCNWHLYLLSNSYIEENRSPARRVPSKFPIKSCEHTTEVGNLQVLSVGHNITLARRRGSHAPTFRDIFVLQVFAKQMHFGVAGAADWKMPLTRLVRIALDETRMLVLGAQILLGFELSGVFRDRFESLPPHARYLDGIALLLILVTVALLITPETHHHLVELGGDTGRFHQLVTRMADCALLPFALSLGLALFIAGESIFGFSLGLAAGGFFLLLALGCWYGLQYLRRLRTGHRERAITARQQTMKEDPSLPERITQMLTEARVVLPGVQALLGFQLVSVISQSFEKLPETSKLVYAVSLGCVTVAVILLMAPAAYHRIVFAGQDTEEMHRVGSWFVTCATIPLAFGLAGDVYVVLREITASARLGAILAGLALVFLVGLWHVLPAVIRLRR